MSLAATVRDTAEALRRQRFARHAMEQTRELHKDSKTWQEYLAEAEGTHVADGIG